MMALRKGLLECGLGEGVGRSGWLLTICWDRNFVFCLSPAILCLEG